MPRGWRLAAAIPAAILGIVAGAQIHLARSAALSPWKGGGFGMFASLDGGAWRVARAFAEAPGRSEEIPIPPSLEDLALRAENLPSPHRLDRLARGLVAEEREDGRPVTRVRVEVWRTEFAVRTLAPTLHRLSSHVAPADQPAR